MHANLDLSPFAVLRNGRIWIVAKTVLTAKLFGNPGKRLRQLRGIVRLIEARSGFVGQLMEITIRPLIVGGRGAGSDDDAAGGRSAINNLRRASTRKWPADCSSYYCDISPSLHGAHVVCRVVLNRVDECVQLFSLTNGALIRRQVA